MIFHNLFTRFPGLQVGIIEHGAVWAPYAVRKMDHGFMMGREARNGKLDQRPSDVFREHFVIAPYPEENISASSTCCRPTASCSGPTSRTRRPAQSRSPM